MKFLAPSPASCASRMGLFLVLLTAGCFLLLGSAAAGLRAESHGRRSQFPSLRRLHIAADFLPDHTILQCGGLAVAFLELGFGGDLKRAFAYGDRFGHLVHLCEFAME